MNVIHFESIDSTNKYIKENRNLENFTFVSTNFQSGGRGRKDRSWLSNSNENLLFSFLIKDENLLKKFNVLSIGTATLIARFLELKGIQNVSVKWPNDVYVDDKKICGILLEGNVKEFVVVGVGLNVNQTMFEGEYRTEPTSMKLSMNQDFNLNELEIELFEFIYKHINQTRFSSNTYKFVEKHNYLLGKKAEVYGFTGTITGISKDFKIVIDGKEINSGEINIIKNYVS